jgi:hypothetical protein
MAVASDILQPILYDFFEDNGFVLGVFDDAKFLDLLNESLTVALTEMCLTSRVFTTTIFAGQGLYQVPDDIMRVDSVFVAGRWLPKATQRDLNNQLRNWRRNPGPPKFWYEDGLQLKTIGLAPAPDYNGNFILGPNAPGPPSAVYDSFSATVVLPSGNVFQNPAQHRNLTIIGPNKNVDPITLVNGDVPTIPADFALGYLGFGVLQRIFSSDSELHDDQKALFASAQFQEGLNLAKAISSEPEST